MWKMEMLHFSDQGVERDEKREQESKRMSKRENEIKGGKNSNLCKRRERQRSKRNVIKAVSLLSPFRATVQSMSLHLNEQKQMAGHAASIHAQWGHSWPLALCTKSSQLSTIVYTGREAKTGTWYHWHGLLSVSAMACAPSHRSGLANSQPASTPLLQGLPVIDKGPLVGKATSLTYLAFHCRLWCYWNFVQVGSRTFNIPHMSQQRGGWEWLIQLGCIETNCLHRWMKQRYD